MPEELDNIQTYFRLLDDAKWLRYNSITQKQCEIYTETECNIQSIINGLPIPVASGDR